MMSSVTCPCPAAGLSDSCYSGPAAAGCSSSEHRWGSTQTCSPRCPGEPAASGCSADRVTEWHHQHGDITNAMTSSQQNQKCLKVLFLGKVDICISFPTCREVKLWDGADSSDDPRASVYDEYELEMKLKNQLGLTDSTFNNQCVWLSDQQSNNLGILCWKE